MKILTRFAVCVLLAVGHLSLSGEGVRVALHAGLAMQFDDKGFDNEVRSDPQGANDSSTVTGQLTPLLQGLIYELYFRMALSGSLNLVDPSDIKKDEAVDITLETFDAAFQRVSFTYLLGKNLRSYEYDLDYGFGIPQDPYPRFRLDADVADPVKSASHATLDYGGGYGFRQHFTNFQNPEENKGATLFVGNVYPDDVKPPQHPSSTAANFKGVALNVDGLTGETLELKAYLSLTYATQLGLSFGDFKGYVDGDENAEGLSFEMRDLTGNENYTFDFGNGMPDEPVYEFRLTYSGGFSAHDFQFGVFTEMDTDEDGIPDDYEDEFGLAKNVNDADKDLDGDGLSNYAEYAAGTAPNDANSVFKIELSELGEFTATVQWTSLPGLVYVVESSANMKNWTRHPGTPDVTATGDTSTMIINLDPLETRHFFRARKKD